MGAASFFSGIQASQNLDRQPEKSVGTDNPFTAPFVVLSQLRGVIEREQE